MLRRYLEPSRHGVLNHLSGLLEGVPFRQATREFRDRNKLPALFRDLEQVLDLIFDDLEAVPGF